MTKQEYNVSECHSEIVVPVKVRIPSALTSLYV